MLKVRTEPKRISQNKDHEKYHPFWKFFSVFFILSIAVVLLSTQNNRFFLTGNIAVQSISSLQKGQEISFEIRNIPGLKDGTIIFTESVKNSLITFKEITPSKFKGKVYTAFTIASPTGSKVKQIKMTLKIKEKELKKLKIAPAELRVYANGKTLVPVMLNTKKIESKAVISDETYFYYTVFSTELGEFIIGKANEASPPKVTTAVAAK